MSDFIQSPTLNLADPDTTVTRSFRGFTGYITLQGDFKSGTVTLDISVDDGNTWIPYSITDSPSGTQLSWTSNGLAKVDLPYCQLRFMMTGAGSGYNIDIYLW